MKSLLIVPIFLFASIACSSQDIADCIAIVGPYKESDSHKENEEEVFLTEDELNQYMQEASHISSKLNTWPILEKKTSVISSFREIVFDEIQLGITVEAKKGNEVHSAGAGIVDWIGNDVLGLGVYIYIYHGIGVYSVYGHLEKALVQMGDSISEDQVIALSGNSGLCDTYCLYFSIFKGIGQNRFGPRTFYDPICIFYWKSIDENN